MKITTTDPETVARRAFFLAYNASDAPRGMGMLQAIPNATEDMTWTALVGARDYQGMEHMKPRTDSHGVNNIRADYLLGRMMKLDIGIVYGLVVRDDECQADYQSWCGKYPTYTALIEAAQESLAAESVA